MSLLRRYLPSTTRPTQARYALGCCLASSGRYEEALEELLADGTITPGAALDFERRVRGARGANDFGDLGHKTGLDTVNDPEQHKKQCEHVHPVKPFP